MTGPKLLKKLSIATAIGKVPTQVVEITNADGKLEKVLRGIEQHLIRVVGLAEDYKTGNSTFGDWVSFTGQFEATNVITGEVFRSGNVFLPDVANDMLLPIVKANKGSQVTIGFDIGAKPFNNAQGYEYTVTPLMAPAENDPLNALKSTLLVNVPALPAPKTPAAQAAAATAAIGNAMTNPEPATVETTTESAATADEQPKTGGKKK